MRSIVHLAMLLLALGVSTSSRAQEAPSAKIFREQYTRLREQADSFVGRVQASRQQAARLREEGLAITALVHRLEEEAMRVDNERVTRGATPDRLLLYVSQACSALDFALSAASRYIDTGDRSFVSLARQGFSLAQAVERYF